MDELDHKTLNLHFILGKERTGSSMLTAMLNQNATVISPSEEPFMVYFEKKYHEKKVWTKEDITKFLNAFWLMHEKNLEYYFSTFNVALDSMLKLSENRKLDYVDFCKNMYLQFLPHKDKTQVSTIVDKQLKYCFYIKSLFNLSPKSKIIFITRDPRENVIRCQKRKIGKVLNTAYQAQIWNEYFKNIALAKKYFGKQCLVIKYENLVESPVPTLQKICNHLETQYNDSMLNFDQSTARFLDKKTKDKTNVKFGEKIADFHSSLIKPLDKNKIATWKHHESQSDIRLIEKITNKVATELDYNFSSPAYKLGLMDNLMIVLAKWNKTYLLKFYLVIPLDIKLMIKRIKGSKINP
mgnify:FL=1